MRTLDPHEVDMSRWIAAARILISDLDRCMTAISASLDTSGQIDQFWARAAVRALFAFIEGSTFEMRRVLLKAQGDGVLELSLPEQALLAELTFDLDKAGRPQSRPKFLQIERNVRFIFALFARAAHSNFQLDVASEGWRCFIATVTVRNRITHPRDPQSLTITAEELKAAVRANSWYSTQLNAFMRTVPGPPPFGNIAEEADARNGD